MHMILKQRLSLALYLAPALLMVAVFIVYPIIQSAYYSFLNWNLVGVKEWAGADNYRQLLHDENFHIAFKNSFIYIVTSIVVQLGIALALALMVFHKIKGSMFFRSVYFTPVVISSVAVALMFLMIFDPDHGLINSFLDIVGLSAWRGQWLADPKHAFYFAMSPKIWQYVGIYVMIYFTGLVGISAEVYESAEVDGTGAFSRFFYITLPLLKEVVFMTIILISVNTWKSFEEIWVLTGGGPAHTTEIIGTYMVNQTFNTFNYGYGSSISVVILIFGILITIGMRYLVALLGK